MINKSQLYTIRKMLGMPKDVLLKRVWGKVKSKIQPNKNADQDLKRDTHLAKEFYPVQKSYIDINQLDLSGIDKSVAELITERYLAHRFDLLGSGWIKYGFNEAALGLRDIQFDHQLDVKEFDRYGNWLHEILLPAHIKSAQKIWSLIDEGYEPIDWHRDMKSGFRYGAKTTHLKSKKLGWKTRGVDLKMLAEIGRLQHLPQLSIYAMLLPEKKEKLIREFRNQCLDFIALNPPRIGPQWIISMDVGIRVCNMLVAYDLFCQIDNTRILDNNFKTIFTQSVYEHAHHIENNLEWADGMTNNHYYANLPGMLFPSAYLDRDKTIDRWYDFAVKELVNETNKQFFDDGGNFEASTMYHRLSAEILLYSLALIARTSAERNQEVPKSLVETAYKAVHICQSWLKPNGEAPQFGDNDSGRFFHFTKVGKAITTEAACKKYLNLSAYANQYLADEPYWDENILDCRSLIAAGFGIFGGEEYESAKEVYRFEASFVRSILGSSQAERSRSLWEEAKFYESRNHPSTPLRVTDRGKLIFREQTTIPAPQKSGIPLQKSLNFHCNKEFQLHIFKSPRLYLAINANTNPDQIFSWGHKHNDILSFELQIDGEDLIVDPGTFVYVPLIEERNRFRSTAVHNVPVVTREEQNRWFTGRQWRFNMLAESKCQIIGLTDNSIALELKYRNIHHIRTFTIEDNSILIEDQCNKPFTVNLNDFKLYSNGYGRLLYDANNKP